VIEYRNVVVSPVQAEAIGAGGAQFVSLRPAVGGTGDQCDAVRGGGAGAAPDPVADVAVIVADGESVLEGVELDQAVPFRVQRGGGDDAAIRVTRRSTEPRLDIHRVPVTEQRDRGLERHNAQMCAPERQDTTGRSAHARPPSFDVRFPLRHGLALIDDWIVDRRPSAVRPLDEPE
jgi:hypothetical protein